MSAKFQPLYRFAVAVARPVVALVTRPTWRGGENLPQDTGFIAAANHISEFDAMTFMHFLVSHEIPVRMMAKAQLFKVPGLGALMRGVGQVPVYRGGEHARDALRDAIAAVNAGECVGIYPEGTITRDPYMWPMKAKTGVGRIALTSRAPVIPIAQWGAQNVLGRYRRIPNLMRRHPVTIVAGPAVTLGDLYDHADEHWAQVEATERIMAAIREQLAEIRGMPVPDEIFDLNRDGSSKAEVAARDKALLRRMRERVQ